MIEQKIPSINLIGCGGAGTNVLKKIKAAIEKTPIAKSVTFKVIDTSKANLQDLGDVEVYSVGNLGSGKDRSKCIQDIQRYLDSHPEISREAADITILLGSFSGGTGSVASPILTQRIMRHSDEKAVIIAGICDTSSERDALNSIATLKSFNRISKDLGVCLPMMLFSNTIKYRDIPKPGRINVDKTIVSRITQLINMLTSTDITELDYSDKMTYLRPQDSGAEPGLYSISITNTDLEHTQYMPGETDILIGENNIVHSLLIVNDDGCTPDVLVNVSYVGVSDNKFVSIMADGIPSMITQDLVDMAEKYQHSAKLKTTLEKDLDKFGSDDQTGLVL